MSSLMFFMCSSLRPWIFWPSGIIIVVVMFDALVESQWSGLAFRVLSGSVEVYENSFWEIVEILWVLKLKRCISL